MNSLIPNIIHHIAPQDELKWHPIWKRCRDSFIENFPNHEFVLWNDRDDIDRLVYDHYNMVWNLYSNFPHHIMKIDFARFCILHKYGGIYADMDYYCYSNFERYLTYENLFLENTSELYTNAKYENCLMASQKHSDFWINTMRASKVGFIAYRNKLDTSSNNWRSYENDFAVNNSTGSGLLSAAVESFGSYFNVNVFPSDKFNQDPIVYNKDLIGRHLHSSLWGDDYIDHSSREGFMIKDGNIWNCPPEHIETEPTAQRWQDFDFYRDYKGVTVE